MDVTNQLTELAALADEGQYKNLEAYLLSSSREDLPRRQKMVQGVIESLKEHSKCGS